MLLNIIRAPDKIEFRARSDSNLPIITIEEASTITKLCVKTIRDILAHNYTIIFKENKEVCIEKK